MPDIISFFSSSGHSTIEALSRHRGPEVQDCTKTLISCSLIAHPSWMLLWETCSDPEVSNCAAALVLGQRVLMRTFVTCSDQLRISYGNWRGCDCDLEISEMGWVFVCVSASILCLHGNTVARGAKQLKVCQVWLQHGQEASSTKLQLQIELFGRDG